MATKGRSTLPRKKRQVEEGASDAAAREAAISDILRVISDSPGNAQPVFDTILEHAIRLCDGKVATLWRYDGDKLRFAAARNATPEAIALSQANPLELGDWNPTPQAALERRVLNVLDVFANPKYRPLIPSGTSGRRPNAGTVLAVPLVRGDELFGVVTIWRYEKRLFSEREVELMKTFTAQAVIAMQNVRLFNETREALEHQQVSADILRIVSQSVADSQPAFEAILAAVRGPFAGFDATVWLLEKDRLVAVARGGPTIPSSTGHSVPATPDHPYGAALRERRPAQLDDVAAARDINERSRQDLLSRNRRAVLLVPFVRDDDCVGAISVSRSEPYKFSEKQVALLKNFAAQAVIAIENARLFNETKQALEQQTATADILRVIASSPASVRPVFDAILEKATHLCEAQLGLLFLLSEATWRMVSHRGASTEAQESHRSFQAGPNTGLGRMLRERRPVHIEDLVADAATVHRDPVRIATIEKLGARTFLAVPLLKDGAVTGAVVIYRKEVRPFGEAQIRLLSTFADQAVIAIENARLFNETQEALEQQTAISEVLRVISGSPSSVQPVLDAVAQRAAHICDARYCDIILTEGSRMRVSAAVGDLGRPLDSVPLDRSTVMGRSIVDRNVVHVADLQSDDAEYPLGAPLARQYGHRTILAVPLVRESHALGTILLRRTDVRPFEEKHIALLRTFADQAAIAIENVRLFNETKEALEHQKASAEVLGTISSSIADTGPVFEKILESCERLFAGRVVGINVLGDDGLIHLGAYHGAGREAFEKVFPLPVDRHSGSGLAIVERRVVHLPDTEVEGVPEAARRGNRARGNRASLYAPMMWSDKAIGVIWVARERAGPFGEREIGLLQTFADQAVIAIENARLFHETRQALEKQTATAEILRVISGTPTDAQPVFEAIVRNATRLCEGVYANVFRFDGERLHWVASDGWPGELLAELKAAYPARPNPSRVAGRVILEGRAVGLEDTHSDREYDRSLARSLRYRRILGVPLLREGKAVGVITVGWVDPGPIDARHEALLKTFADQAVIAIENARLFNETKEALEQQTATAGILKVIAESPADVRPVFEAILHSAVTLCDAQLAATFPFDGKQVHLGATHNWPSDALEYFAKVYPSPPSEHLLSGRTILGRSIVEIEDAAADPSYDPDSVATGHWRRMLGVPMLRKGEPLGAMVVAWRDPGKTPARQVELLQTFANQAAIAIENVRLFNETKEALDQQKASAEVLGAISGSIADTKPVFEKILASCERLFHGDLVGVTLVEGEMVRLAAYHGPGSEGLSRIYPLPLTRESGTGWAILNAAIAHFPDIEGVSVPGGVVAGCRALGVRAIVFAPMLFQGSGIGAIWVARQQPGAFNEKQIAQLSSFADQAVIAIQNARLFREIQEKSAQLEIANHHKSEFLANMSHELRTPLNAIIGFSEVLSERMFGEVNEKQAEYLKDIHESGRHLLSLINDILDLSKIEAGRMELEVTTFDLPTALSNAMTLIRERAQRHGIQLGMEVDPALGEFSGDERKFKQIMLNLLSNAVKFTPDGGKVDILATRANGAVEVAVRDTGIGIAPEDQQAVFEEFRQVGRDQMRKAEGTGLGLALTKRFVELHGGAIRLHSTPGQGSTFTVSLPLSAGR